MVNDKIALADVSATRPAGFLSVAAISVVLLLLVACHNDDGQGGGPGAPPPSSLTYASPVDSGVGTPLTALTPTVNGAAATLTPTVTGTVESFAVTPALPAGRSLNTSSGAITGIPTAAVAQSNHTIIATNVSGHASFALSLAVNAAVSGAPPIDTAAIDTKAQTLAAQILGGGDQTLDSVQQAVLAAGFGILAQDGTVTRPDPAASQGMQFTQWDIYVMSKGIQNGGYTGLSDFGAALQQDFPEIEATELISQLIADINTQSQSTTNAGLRLWARLIIDLGQQAKVPYDLTDPNLDPTTVDLSPLQLGLIAQRFVGDLTIMSSEAPQGTRILA